MIHFDLRQSSRDLSIVNDTILGTWGRLRSINRQAFAQVKMYHLKFNRHIIQEQTTYSGGAIGATLKNFHGDQAKQSDLGEMIDFSLKRSGYEPFQTWRILLRRLLTSRMRYTVDCGMRKLCFKKEGN